MQDSTIFDDPVLANYLKRIGAEPRGLLHAVIRQDAGRRYWRDIAVVKFERDGTIVVLPQIAEAMPTDSELMAFKRMLEESPPPYSAPATFDDLTKLPQRVLDGEHWNFLNLEGNRVLLVQNRIVKDEETGAKAYIPWTFWSDGQWRCQEPEGQLPLFGLQNLKQEEIVFLHEGVKGAEVGQRIFEGKDPSHPWANALSSGVHLGWIGGALNPHRTNWSPIRRSGAKLVYIVADNDNEGQHAVRGISYYLRCKTFGVYFTDEWPPGFDLADEWPSTMFKEHNEIRYYIGPSFDECLSPATYLTDMMPNSDSNGKEGKPIPTLRPHAKDLWTYCDEADVWASNDMPSIQRPSAVLERHLAPFSQIGRRVINLLQDHQIGNHTKLAYRPDAPRRITVDGQQALNTYMPPSIQPLDGDPKPFIDFLDNLIPGEEDRKVMEKWIATLIARPKIHIGWAVLMISEEQGVGKTTLGSVILPPLVGHLNTSTPGEAQILSDFNDWCAHKRLVVVNEIYNGHSWKSYNLLKTHITDPHITVNRKHQTPYQVDNWCHIYACSNSTKAMRMDADDRRWFVPRITDTIRPPGYWKEFYAWLGAGGLGIIMRWAQEYGEYIFPGGRAPETIRKEELIDDTMSQEQAAAIDLAQKMAERTEPTAITSFDVRVWLHKEVNARVNESDSQIRKTMTRIDGIHRWPKRVKNGGRNHYLIINQALQDATQQGDNPIDLLRSSITPPWAIKEGQL